MHFYSVCSLVNFVLRNLSTSKECLDIHVCAQPDGILCLLEELFM